MYDNSKSFYIDNITYNDLSLSDLFDKLNQCETSCGEDYLYNRFRNPFITNNKVFDEFTKLLDEDFDIPLLKTIGKLKGKSFDDFINDDSLKSDSNGIHYFSTLFVLISFILIFIIPGPGLLLFFVSVGFSVSNYFKYKNILSSKLSVFNYIISILKNINNINCDKDTKSVYAARFAELNDLTILFKPFMRGSFFIASGVSTSGNIVSIILDYLRLIFHVDIIKYNNMISFIAEHKTETLRIYEIVGELDASLSVKKFKEHYDAKSICKPIFIDERHLSIVEGYHPLLENPISNSISIDKGVLITGSNASGKSTFLKSIAINALFAQSFGFTFANQYEAPFYKIMTSMALNDSIIEGDSYFMAEIKSLKRIFDEQDNIPILCIVDEVLRGTNTVERISASVEILKALNDKNIQVFAATHDIELTELLNKDYENYHFSENITDNDIKFNYMLLDGPANSKNAIKLLSLLGFEKAIVNKATERVDMFLKTGEYK